jgi:hypothetical protein
MIVSLSERGTDRYLPDEVLRWNEGKSSPGAREGVNPSSGPREGVEAESWPPGVAVRKVPLLLAE